MEATATPYFDIISYDELRSIAKQPFGVCVSLFLSTHPAERAHLQAQIQLGNLLQQAERMLAARDISPATIEDLLAPIRQLTETDSFWTHQSAGLAILIAPELLRVYRLPIAFEPLAVIDKQPYILPLLPLLQNDGRFYLLALGLDGVQLWCASHFGFSRTPLPGAPTSLRSTLKYDVFAKQAQWHPGLPGRGGERGAIFHGQGALDDQQAKEEVARYFQQVDRAVHAALHDQHAPLVLAGLDYLVAIYRAVNSYPHLVEPGIVGNPSSISHAELHAQAWSSVAGRFELDCLAAVERYRMLLSTQPSLATNYLRAIVPAACAGRVATLFVAAGQQRWGQFETDTGVLTLHEVAARHDSELLNFAAMHTLIHGGRVYIVGPEQLPEAAPIAAMMRY